MPILDSLIGPLASIIDKLIPDKTARDKAKLELLQLQGSQDMEMLQTRLSAIVAEANSHDPWTSRARPSFLYVIYAMILWAIPMGVLAAFRPEAASQIAAGMNAYLNGLPEPLCAIYEPRFRERLFAFLGAGIHCPRKAMLNSWVELLIPPEAESLANANTPEEQARLRATLSAE